MYTVTPVICYLVPKATSTSAAFFFIESMLGYILAISLLL